MMRTKFPWSDSISFAECFTKIGTVRESALIANFSDRQLAVQQHFFASLSL